MILAALGGEIEVPTLKGPKTITIPSGSQFGDRIALKGEGVPHIRGTGIGDFIIELLIQVPKRLTKQQKELLEKLDESFQDSKKKNNGGFFQRIFE